MSDREWIEMVEGERGRVRAGDIYPRVRDWLGRAAPRDILDIGCGQGILCTQIDVAGHRYTGVDPSAEMIDRACENYAAAHRRFLHGDAYALPVPGAAFDAVFSIAVWHLLEDLDRAARELRRVLRP